MRLLAFDTSGAAIAAVAADEAECLAWRDEPLARGHAERLLPVLSEIVTEAGWAWLGVDLVATVVGPGSFTGLRAGLSVARALALALDCRTLGLGALELMAEGAADAVAGNELPIAVLVDGRRGEYFVQCFTSGLAPLAPPALLPPARLAAVVPTPCLLTGKAAGAARDLLGRADFLVEPALDARALARAVWRRLAAGVATSPGTALRPVYLRAPDARPGAGASLLPMLAS